MAVRRFTLLELLADLLSGTAFPIRVIPMLSSVLQMLPPIIMVISVVPAIGTTAPAVLQAPLEAQCLEALLAVASAVEEAVVAALAVAVQ